MRVLYICTGNSFRSPVAEALTRKYRPRFEVESAGIEATDHVADVAEELLEQDGALEFVKPSPDQISRRALDEADLVVCMMPEHREYVLENFDISEDKVVVWHIEDPIEPNVEAAISFQQLRENVRSL